MYVSEFYLEPQDARKTRKAKELTQRYIKNANFYYLLLGAGVVVYWFQLHHELYRIQALLRYVTPEYIERVVGNFISSCIDHQWDTMSWIALGFFSLMSSFILINIYEDLQIKWNREAAERQLEEQRAKKSSCTKVSTEEFESESKDITK